MNNVGRLSVIATEAIADDGTQWVEIMPTVEKDRNGPYYFTLTRDDLEVYAEDIRARPGQIPIDYDHASTGVGTKAAGWFAGEAEVRESDDGFRLWAAVKWTSSAVAAIRDGEWKRISPEFLFDDRDPSTGLMTKAKNMIAATLTNRPHFDQLSPVSARDLLDSSEIDGFEEIFGAHAAGAILGALSGNIEAVRTAATKATTSKGDAMSDYTAIAAELGLDEAADEGKVLEAVRAVKLTAAEALAARGTAAIPTSALTLVGVPEHASEQTFLTAVRAKDDRIAEWEQRATGLQTQADQAVTLAKRVTELEREKADYVIEQILREEVKAMRVLPTEVEQLAAQFSDNPDGLKTLVNARPPGLFAHLTRPQGSGASSRVDAELRVVGKEFGATDSIPVDEDSARLHVAAIEILREQNKEHGYTDADYVAALTAAASRTPTFA
jgi:phage I-like protein